MTSGPSGAFAASTSAAHQAISRYLGIITARLGLLAFPESLEITPSTYSQHSFPDDTVKDTSVMGETTSHAEAAYTHAVLTPATVMTVLCPYKPLYLYSSLKLNSNS